ncbi:cardiolipin synthase ClsB [Jeongeupia sp. USM3]|uniref:cardiolipin synthase ClsB n=1 Tax=Jeongeupia sp. USM3 TaxID=1906741 RepID=UPI00089E0AAD|nr:cardiolipin synthase ClsB [Jeongeupia sp. USM3]AOX99250.1 cardiolipin synthase B [Jeongeupia sp. USM3]
MTDFVRGNHLTLLYNGADFFPALIAAIESARREIYLESYLFETDAVGIAVIEALMAAARRGVSVQMQIDGFGARNFPAGWQARLGDAGVRLLFFRPEVGRFSLNRQRLRRLHRKLTVVDGQVGFIGGINILSDVDSPELAPRYDYSVRVNGPLVAQMRETADRVWRHTAWVQLQPEWARTLPAPPKPMKAGQSIAKLAIRDNFRNRHAIEQEYLRAIETARDEIIIANAYFLPGYRFRHALLRAAERGVSVVLLLQGRVDHALLHYASRGFYHSFLKAGIEIYEYRKGFMHAKVAVVDRYWATVGSSNIDPFSLLLAREANIVVRDHDLAGALRDDLQRRLDHDSVAIAPDDLRRGRWYFRILPWISHGIVRVLMAISGYGGRRYLE